MRIVTINASTSYDVCIGANLLDRAGEIAVQYMKPCRAMIISDSIVAPLYGERVASSFRERRILCRPLCVSRRRALQKYSYAGRYFGSAC